MKILLEAGYMAGWLVFVYLGGAGAYELLGGRRYRATLLLVGAFHWIILTFVYFRYFGAGVIGVICTLLYFVGCVFLVRTVHRQLGKLDIYRG